jgi:4-amino-4-deoxy-L-arabinose transferase-like glycosyltransferase
MEPRRDQQTGPITSAAYYGVGLTILAVLVALTVLFLVWPAQQVVDTRPDPYNYSAIARQMLAEGFAAHGLTKREASLYPVMIAAVYRLAGEQPLLVKLLQCVMFGGTCLLAFDIGRRLFGLRAGIIAGLLVTLNPVLLRYVADLQMETMLTFAITLNVWTMVRFYQNPTARSGLLVGLIGGLAALTKAVALVPLGLFGMSWIVRGILARRRGVAPIPWIPLAAMFLATVVVILPWTVRNYRVTGGRFVLIGPGANDAFLRGYVFSRSEYALLRRPPYTDAENECNAWFRELCLRAGTEVGRDEVLDERIFAVVAKRKIVDEPLELVRKTVVGLFTFWYQMTSVLNSLVVGLTALIAWVLALIGWRRSRRDGRPAWLLLMPVLSMNISIALLCSLGRYSVPILPCLLIVSAVGVDTLLPGHALRQTA